MAPRSLRRSTLAVAAAALIISACVQQTGHPADCASASAQRAVTLQDDKFTPERIDLCKGQAVTLVVTVQEAGDLHFHGYDDIIPETAVTVGEHHAFTFSAAHVGQFPIELHPPVGDEVQVGILTVYEP